MKEDKLNVPAPQWGYPEGLEVRLFDQGRELVGAEYDAVATLLLRAIQGGLVQVYRGDNLEVDSAEIYEHEGPRWEDQAKYKEDAEAEK